MTCEMLNPLASMCRHADIVILDIGAAGTTLFHPK